MLTAKRITEVDEVLNRLSRAQAGLKSLINDERSDDTTDSRKRVDELRKQSDRLEALTNAIARLYS